MPILDSELKRKWVFYDVPWICEHASCSAVFVCHLGPNSRRERMADSDGSSQSGAGTHDFETSEVRTGSGRGRDVSHALRGFYELADILIVLDEILLLEISTLTRQLKFSPIIGDDHPIISHLTASLWFRGIDLIISSSTGKSRGPSNESCG